MVRMLGIILESGSVKEPGTYHIFPRLTTSMSVIFLFPISTPALPVVALGLWALEGGC